MAVLAAAFGCTAVAGALGSARGAEPARAFFPQSVASGDPTSDSVILWTRVTDDARPGEDLEVALEVAATPEFTEIVLVRTGLLARAAHDGCVKVRVENLQPYKPYWYRFTYGEAHRSRVGRTKTAPAPHQAQRVRFAFLSCQDYVGRYYNTLAHLVEAEAGDLDFVVYLGDYIYETVRAPGFQTPSAQRRIDFSDRDGAIPLGSGESPPLAAASLDNYRELYRVYRSDPTLQRLHELFPVLNIWDDHEFSDDAHGVTATYFDGRSDESDIERKRNAERAFFEYLPVGVGIDDVGVRIDESVLYPNTHVYRALRFGAFLDLALTDTRTFRPDHLIPEDAFPGAIVIDEPSMAGLLGPLWSFARIGFEPYVDLGDPANATLREAALPVVADAYTTAGLPAEAADARATAAVGRKLSAPYLNELFQAAGQPPPFPPETAAGLERGLAYRLLGKLDLFSAVGARYIVPYATFKILAAYEALRDAERQDLLGAAQRHWLEERLRESDATWKVVGSSVSLTPIHLDFANPVAPLPPELPAELRTRIQLNAEDWNGFPEGKRALVDLLAAHDATLISGDVHSSFITEHVAGSGAKVPEFTGASVSSSTVMDGVMGQIDSHPILRGIAGLDALAAVLDRIVQDASTRLDEAEILDLELASHGYVVLEAGPLHLRATYRHWPSAEVHNDSTAGEALRRFSATMRESRYEVTFAEDGGLALKRLVPEPPELRVRIARSADNGVAVIAFPTAVGKEYSVEVAEALGRPWRLLPGSVGEGDGQTQTVRDPESADQTRFYRVSVRDP